MTQGGEGLVVRGRSKGNIAENKTNRDKSRSKSRHKSVVCYNCKKKGHIKKFCPEKGKNKGKWNENGSTSYNSPVIVHRSDDEGFWDDSHILLTVELEYWSRE